MAAKKKHDDDYEEPNPELGSAREAAEAAANPPNPKPATPKATGDTDTKE